MCKCIGEESNMTDLKAHWWYEHAVFSHIIIDDSYTNCNSGLHKTVFEMIFKKYMIVQHVKQPHWSPIWESLLTVYYCYVLDPILSLFLILSSITLNFDFISTDPYCFFMKKVSRHRLSTILYYLHVF